MWFEDNYVHGQIKKNITKWQPDQRLPLFVTELWSVYDQNIP